MKKRIDIEFCDICKREDSQIFTECDLCHRGMCVICRGVGFNPFNINLCKDCIKRDDVQEIFKKTYHYFKDGRKKTENLLQELD